MLVCFIKKHLKAILNIAMQRSRSSTDHQIPVIATNSKPKRAFIKHGRVNILRLIRLALPHSILPNQRPLPIAPDAQHAIIPRGKQRAEPRMERDLRHGVGVRADGHAARGIAHVEEMNEAVARSHGEQWLGRVQSDRVHGVATPLRLGRIARQNAAQRVERPHGFEGLQVEEARIAEFVAAEQGVGEGAVARETHNRVGLAVHALHLHQLVLFYPSALAPSPCLAPDRCTAACPTPTRRTEAAPPSRWPFHC